MVIPVVSEWRGVVVGRSRSDVAVSVAPFQLVWLLFSGLCVHCEIKNSEGQDACVLVRSVTKLTYHTQCVLQT